MTKMMDKFAHYMGRKVSYRRNVRPGWPSHIKTPVRDVDLTSKSTDCPAPREA